MKDYKAISLSYQPCNRPIDDWKKKPKTKKNRRRKSEKVSKLMLSRAEKNRSSMTPSETALDLALTETLPRHGLKHESQWVIGQRIADFTIPAKRLVIEVDGEYHFFRGRQDGFRTKQIKKRGWKVIRFTNHAVDTDILGVLNEILQACGSQYATC